MENNEITALLKKGKTKFSVLLFFGTIAAGCVLGSVPWFQTESTRPIGVIFLIFGVIAGIVCISLFNSYRALKQQLAEKIEKDPAAAETHKKTGVFEKKKGLRQYPIMLVLCILCLAYLYFSGSDTPIWYYAIVLILIPVGIVRHFAEKKKVDKQLQENGWEGEEKEYYAATREHGKKTAIKWVKGIAIVLAIIVAICFFANIGSTGTNNHKSNYSDYGASDYIKDNAPDLYDTIVDRYNSLLP